MTIYLLLYFWALTRDVEVKDRTLDFHREFQYEDEFCEAYSKAEAKRYDTSQFGDEKPVGIRLTINDDGSVTAVPYKCVGIVAEPSKGRPR